MRSQRSFRFTKAITRLPANSVVDALRAGQNENPDATIFAKQHKDYCNALKNAGATLVQLPKAEKYPDSVFIEDAAICLEKTAILLRPGATSRLGESALLRPDLAQHFEKIIDLPTSGTIDGGDVMLSDQHAFIGLSQRTNEHGRKDLGKILYEYGYQTINVNTPADILHFKTECGLLDEATVFATRKIANTGCFDKYRVVETPAGEEGGANIVRFNDHLFLSAGYPKSQALLTDLGYQVHVLDTSQPALVDGGLSCMSLRF